MKNPLTINQKSDKSANIVNPYIYRYNGKYYMFTTKIKTKSEMHCYVSDDLLNWSNPKVVFRCDNQVIYCTSICYNDGLFYMIGQNKDGGHVMLQAKNILGQYRINNDNVDQNEGGTLYKNSLFAFRYFRTNDKGFSLSDMDINAKISNRKDILQEMNVKMIDPDIIYRDCKYYLTYKDANTNSINYIFSDDLDKHYQVNNYHQLLKLEDDSYRNIGSHNMVLAPDLDGYYMCYSLVKEIKDKKGNVKKEESSLCLDRVRFNGTILSSRLSLFEKDNPKLPDVYADFEKGSKGFRKINDKYLSVDPTGEIFTAEFNQKGKMNVIVSYYDDANYILIKGFKNTIVINNIFQGKNHIIVKKDLPINFKYHHTLRVICSEFKAEYLIDDVSIAVTSKLPAGKIGYVSQDKKGIGYTAFSNASLGSSDLNMNNIIPGMLDCLHDLKKKETNLDKYDDVYFSSVYEKEVISFKTLSDKKEDYYHLSVLINPNYSTSLRVTSLLEEKVFEIDAISCEYPYYLKDLGYIKIAKEDEIKIRVNKGVLVYKAFDIRNKD